MPANPPDLRPSRVAIVGGGCAGMAAAWQLSRRPGIEIDVYERSWRLGGKAASVRDGDGRILDHGLHVWLGFYENAFRMMRDCYAEVDARNLGPLTHRSFDDAFLPEPHVGVAKPGRGGSDWEAWSSFFPPEKGLPGTELDADSNPYTLASYLLRCFGLLKALTLSVIGPTERDIPGRPRPEGRSAADEAIDLDFALSTSQSGELLIRRMAELLRAGTLTGAALMLQAVTIIEKWLQGLNFAQYAPSSILKLTEAVAAQMRKLLRELTDVDESIRMRTEVIDIVVTIVVGLFRDRVLFDDRGLDAINQFDYRDWLENHGATNTALESRFLKGIYDFVFAYEGGDHRKPRLAAGVAVRGALRMFFTYRGAMFWRVQSGMGDAVFAPLYRVLATPTDARSPVRFHFLHDLADVVFSDEGGRHVAELRFRTLADDDELRRLGEDALDARGCWPEQDWARFAEASRTAREEPVLRVGEHFDAVILATGVEQVAKVCATDKRRSLRKWTRMGDEVKTVATKHAQVWLRRDTEGLGWYRGPVLLTALGTRFDTWADMTNTLPAERAWRPRQEDDGIRSVAYFCAAMPDWLIAKTQADLRREGSDGAGRPGVDALVPAPPEWTDTDLRQTLHLAVAADLEELLRTEMRPIWPDAFREGGTAYDLAAGGYVQANFAGSERYTLSLPGSLGCRISPLDRTVENMTIAGDWTACGLDAGCIEAAVMSGMLAACALTGEPEPRHIIGYDHP